MYKVCVCCRNSIHVFVLCGGNISLDRFEAMKRQAFSTMLHFVRVSTGVRPFQSSLGGLESLVLWLGRFLLFCFWFLFFLGKLLLVFFACNATGLDAVQRLEQKKKVLAFALPASFSRFSNVLWFFHHRFLMWISFPTNCLSARAAEGANVVMHAALMKSILFSQRSMSE